MLEISCVVVQGEDLFLSSIFEWMLLNFPLLSSHKSQSSTVFRRDLFHFWPWHIKQFKIHHMWSSYSKCCQGRWGGLTWVPCAVVHPLSLPCKLFSLNTQRLEKGKQITQLTWIMWRDFSISLENAAVMGSESYQVIRSDRLRPNCFVSECAIKWPYGVMADIWSQSLQFTELKSSMKLHLFC